MTIHDAELVDALRRGLMPRDFISFPDWADRYIVLERGGKPFRWQTSLTPYLRQPMLDASPDSPVEEIVIVKPSQVGASEAFAVAFPMYMADVAPCNVLEFRPDLAEAARFKQLRVDVVIESSPHMRALFREKKSRDSGNTQHLLVFDGGSWTILGSNSPAALSSLPAAVVIFDERDRMAASAGAGDRAEGDQYMLAKARTITFRDTFPRRKLIQISSPGDTSTSRIEPAWLASDRRRYHVPCSECGRMIKWLHSRLWWARGADPRTARYRCQLCDRLLDERAKPEMLAAGEWLAEIPDRDVRGYKLVGLDSPFMLWGELAEERERVKGNPNEFRVYVNTKEGESYDAHGETRVDSDRLAVLRVDIALDDGHPVIPRAVRALTAGVDVQHDRLEVGLYGWARGEECWHLDYRVLRGDPSGDQVWDDLDRYLRSEWVTEDDEIVTLDAACIDTSYLSHRVYDFVRLRGVRAVWGVKGSSIGGKRVWPKRPSRTTYRKTEIYLVGTDTAKLQIYARLKASVAERAAGATPGPGHVHLAAHLADDDYLAGLTAEVPVTKTVHGHPRIVWDKPDGKRNEPLDCAVYGYAALHGWKAKGRRLDSADKSRRARRPRNDITSRPAQDTKRDTTPAEPPPPTPETAPRAVRRQPPPPHLRKIAPSYMDRD